MNAMSAEQPLCAVEDCGSAPYVRGWCRKHYTRWQRHGDPEFTHVPLRGKDEERFLAKVFVTSDVPSSAPELGPCWLWTASKNVGGYGRFGIGRDVKLAHRWAYEHWIGPIPDGFELDHFACERPDCVNPSHVRPVTRRENTLRGNAPPALAASRTHCPQGHPYDDENTYYYRGDRQCRACHRVRATETQRRRRRAKTHCQNGHEYTDDNIIWGRDGRRICKTCAKRNKPPRQPAPKMSESEREERFWSYVNKDGPDGCWIWHGGRNTYGYGYFHWPGYSQGVHVIAWKLAGREIPKGWHLHHKCRRRACLNPDHLEPVTPADHFKQKQW